MNTKKLLLAGFSALYMSGAVSAAELWNADKTELPAHLIKSNLRQQVDIPAAAISSTVSAVKLDRLTSMPESTNVVNRQVTRRDKFISDPEITGIHDFFIIMEQAPVALYTGGINGLAATHLKTVAKEQQSGLMTNDSSASKVSHDQLKQLQKAANYQSRVNAYQQYLLQSHQQLVSSAAQLGMQLQIKHQYTNALNAFTVSMDQNQAAELANLSSIRAITPVKTYLTEGIEHANFPSSHEVTNANKLWQLDGGYKGEGMIIGVADTGINPASRSFSEIGDDGYVHQNPLGNGNFLGDCATDEWRSLCNNKLIGVYSYPQVTSWYRSQLARDVIEKRGEEVDLSGNGMMRPDNGIDYVGHGSHTSGIAGGNVVNDVDYLYRQFRAGPGVVGGEEKLGTVTGVAPHANIISYQVCLPGGGGDPMAGCLSDVMVAAIDQALIDGVDVLNWSIGGGSRDPWGDPILLGFLSLKEQGIHVTAAAGNNGGYQQVSNVTPWSLSVAATELGRKQENIGSATLQFSTDGIDFNRVDLGGDLARSISGEVTAPAFLAAEMGACINDDCSPAPVCEDDYDMINDMCYLQCTDIQERNSETLLCELKDSQLGADGNKCLVGEKLDDFGNCVDDHSHGFNSVTWESICAGGEAVIYPQFEGIGIDPSVEIDDSYAQQGFACPTYQIEQCAENHQGFSGASAGKCCAYGVIDDISLVDRQIWPGHPFNITDSFHGACHGPTGPMNLENGKILEKLTTLSTFGHSIESVVEAKPSAVVQTLAPIAPLMKVLDGDPHCLDFDRWKDPIDPSFNFDFNDKIIVCARGDDTVKNNIPRLQKAESAGALGAAGMVMYNDNKDYGYNSRISLAVNIKHEDVDTGEISYTPFPYIHVGNATWKKGLGRETLRQNFLDNDTIYLTINSVKQGVDYDPKQIKDLAGFSSKGPNRHYPSLMGPSIAAPGVNIYAPFTNDGAFQNKSNSADFAFDTGTSMAAPHLAGVMALMTQVRPEWSAAERESAIMLSAGQVTGGSWKRINCSGLDIENNIDNTDYANGTDSELCPEYDEDNIFHQKFIYEAPVIDPETGDFLKDDEGEVIEKTYFSYFKRQKTKSYEAGSGLVDVKAAINSAILMDESHTNFLNADPKKGGDLRQLNLPYLFDGECAGTCRWTRTFTSNAAGTNTWNVNVETGETSLQLEASPSNFTLQKGQSVTVLFTATMQRASSANSFGTGMVSGEVHLIPENTMLGSSKLPVGVALVESRLPLIASGVASENIGQFPINNIAPWGSADDLMAKVYQSGAVTYLATNPSDATKVAKQGAGEFTLSDIGNGGTWVGQVDLSTDDTPTNWDWENAANDDSVRLLWVDIPANTKLFGVDVLERIATTSTESGNPGEFWLAGDLFIAVGRDNNGNGEIEFEQEGICLSTSDIMNNNCMLTNPASGRYWVYLQNVGDKGSKGIFEYLRDTYQYAVTVVTDHESDVFSVVAPQSYDGTTPMSLDLVYDVELNQGDALYGMVELGTSEYNLSNLGAMPVRLSRGEDAFTMQVSNNKIKAGNYIKVDVNYAKNHTGYARSFELDFEVPEGLTYIPYSIGGDPRFVTGYSDDAEGITISGNQPNSYNLLPFYQMTTNVNPQIEEFENHPLAVKYSAMCATPPMGNYFDGSSPKGGYVDMARLNPRAATPPYGSEEPDRMGSWQDNLRIDVKQLFGFASEADFNLFDAPNKYNELRVSPMGYIDSGTDYPLFGIPYGDPFGTMHGLPDIRLGPLMIGSHSMQLTTGKVTPKDSLDAFDAQGITVGAFMSETNKNILIEWDNAYTIEGQRYSYGSTGINQNDSYDFQAILDLEYSYEMGSYEIIYAYDNLNMTHSKGSIGFHGMAGVRGVFGPAGGFRNNSVAYDNLEDILHDDLVICFDFIGADYSKTNFSFWLKVDEGYAGQEVDLTVKTKLNRITKSVTQTLSVAGNISINEISDVVINQGETLSIPVIYNDLEHDANVISVDSKHLLTKISGNEPGAMLTIDASCDFSGSTEVDVIVTDRENSNDVATTSFSVQVQTVAGFTPSSNCSGDESSAANTDDLSDDDSSGGSMAIMMLSLLFLLRLVRFKLVK
ncbi:S8 family serine peptidase [Thalassotalea fonticola]|uniref:S8 family serine peptidase n=1 Tax=Thalassotalea fonticola TaxID=3065649 RepID=A0ABZ0GSG2_9GAMM|nr:S8 family serine peptidase [Colwelliaceae bacterium S1-1]